MITGLPGSLYAVRIRRSTGTWSQTPYPPFDPKYPRFTCAEVVRKEGIPRLLDLWDGVDRGHEAAGHGQTWELHKIEDSGVDVFMMSGQT
jgi:hypothetical protein